jgi:hypothetical protein
MSKKILLKNKNLDIYKMKEFYKGKGSQQKCFDQNSDKEFFVCLEQPIGNGKKTNTYAGFKNHEDFFNWRLNEGKDYPANFYELIKDGDCIEYYDIDGYYTNPIFCDDDGNPLSDDKILRNFIDARIEFGIEIEDDFGSYPVKDTDFYVVSTPDPDNKKASLHIYIRNGMKFKNNHTHLKSFVRKFRDFCLDYNRPVEIDVSVYSKNRLLRMINNHKFGQTERKGVRSTDLNYKSKTCHKRMFFATYLEPELQKSQSVYYPSFVDEKKPSKPLTKEEIDLLKVEDDELKTLVGLITKSIREEYSSICDKEYPDKLGYENWRNLIFGVWGCCKDEKEKIYYYDILKDLYRHIDDIDEEAKLKHLLNYDYKQITIKSLHYLARQNNDYNTHFGYITEKLKDKKYIDIKHKERSRRTPQEQTYLDKINENMVNKQINSLFEMNNNKYVKVQKINKDVKWVKDIQFPEGYRCIGIKAGLGRGKTSSLIRYVSNLGNNAKVLILSPRITFTKNITSEYNSKIKTTDKFISYLEYREKSKSLKGLNFCNKVVCSMESLHYLSSFTPDLLIIDEINANLISHLSITNGENVNNNVFEFIRMINYSKQVVVADAFLGSKALNYFTDLKMPIFVYDYKTNLDKRNAYILPNTDPEVKKAIAENCIKQNLSFREHIYINDSMYLKLKELLEKDKNVYMFNSNRTKQEFYEKTLGEKYKSMFYSGRKDTKIPDDLNEEWTKYNLVSTTSTITVGCNQDKRHFNTCLVDFSSSSKNNVSDAIQAHYRVRNLIDNDICVKVENDKAVWLQGFPINLKNQKEQMETKLKFYKEQYKSFEKSPEVITNLYLHNYLEKQLSINNPVKLMKRYLTECNYDIVEISSSKDVVYDDKLKSDVKITDIIRDLVDNTPNQYRVSELEKIKLIRKLTDSERDELDRFWFTSIYTGNTSTGYRDIKLPVVALAYSIWKTQFNGKKYIKSLRYEKMLLDGKITLSDLVEKRWDKMSFAELHSSDLIKLRRVIYTCKKLGLKHMNDTETIIPQEKMDEFYEEAKHEYDNFKLDMGLKDRRKDKDKEITINDFERLIKSVFTNSPNFCKLENVNKKTIRINGKQKRIKDFKLIHNGKIIESIENVNESLIDNDIENLLSEENIKDLFDVLQLKDHEKTHIRLLKRED